LKQRAAHQNVGRIISKVHKIQSDVTFCYKGQGSSFLNVVVLQGNEPARGNTAESYWGFLVVFFFGTPWYFATLFAALNCVLTIGNEVPVLM
jgi:hypothetical protein